MAILGAEVEVESKPFEIVVTLPDGNLSAAKSVEESDA